MKKLSREQTVNLAKSYAEKGFYCSEAVLLTFCDLLDIQSDLVPAIATGFGAGIGRRGAVCGAVSGAVMGLGLRFGSKDVPSEKVKSEEPPHWFALEILTRFEKAHGSYLCRDLIKSDLDKSEGRQQYVEKNHWETTCREVIGSAAGLAWDIFMEREKQKT